MMKIIGAGFGRTGTSSVKVALDDLGFGPCHHMTELFHQPERAARWEAAAAGQPVGWHELLAGYHATVDWPACTFYAQLMEAYPEALVLLTVRDPERWYQSCRDTIYRSSASRADSAHAGGTDPVAHMIDTIIWQGTFGGAFEEKQRAISIFERHNQEVRERVPSDRLLVYDVKQGWEPLCRFLGVDVPAGTPFPHLNDTMTFQQMEQEHERSVETR